MYSICLPRLCPYIISVFSLFLQTSGHNLHLLAAVATPEGQPPGQELQVASATTAIMENGNGFEDIEQSQSHASKGEGGGGGAEDPSVEPERPYPCEVCGRKFIRATHLRRHMRIHTGEKPFACHICGRRYARGDYLRAHIHAHRRDKIHKCKHCGEVFHDLTRFADHCRLLHKDLEDQFGNPKAPPESSPPPPSFSTLLGAPLEADEAEAITVVPSINMMDFPSSIPITLVTLPETSEQDMTITMGNPPTHYTPTTVSHTLPTPNHTPITSPELQLAQLQALAAQNDNHLLIQNGQLQIADAANEVTVFSHPSHSKATPISYMDPLTQYIYSTDGSNHGNTAAMFPTPQSSPLVDQNHPRASR